MVEYFIAKKYLKAKHKLSFISIISIISTLGITIGVAALIIVLSVFNGFGELVTSMMVSNDPHLRLIPEKGSQSEISNLEKFLNEKPEVVSVIPYIEGKVLLQKGQRLHILNLKGIPVNKARYFENLNNALFFGKFNLNPTGNFAPIFIGFPSAVQLGAKNNDLISICSFNSLSNSVTLFSIPRTKRFVLKGIYQTHSKNLDYNYALTSYQQAKSVLGLKKEFSGVDIKLKNIDLSQSIKNLISQKFGKSFKIQTWYDLHKDLYFVMKIERWSAFIILCLIIAVASFNILSSLTMTVLEKKKDIAILRAIGFTKKSIKRIFMFEGLLISFIGTIAGLIIGISVCLLQINYKFYTLDSRKYIIDSLPVKIEIPDILFIVGATMILSLMASLYPAKKALKTNIVESLKWD